jgi:two-component system, OmpR family, sensor histidine kinase SenX3
MRITSRTKAIAFFIALGACLVALAVFLNVSWIVFHQRSTWLLVLGVVFFSVIIAGLVVNTIFIVREIRRNERQDSFLNAVTHELKTPIASIRLYLETLQRRPLDDAQRNDFYRIMLEDSERLLGTVEQVLKAGEVRHGTHRRNWQEVNFTAIVTETLELARLRHHLPAESLRFGAQSSEELLVMGNPEELRTAVFNLFDNAIKYSGTEKDIVVDVLTPNLDSISLSVRDHGIGIPAPELKRIFNRFYRVPRTSAAASQVKGTGLGLFIVRSVARRYGGDAYAESQGEGLGSTFTIRLPRVYRA